MKYFFGAALVLVLAPVGAVVYHDTALRQEISDNIGGIQNAFMARFNQVKTAGSLKVASSASTGGSNGSNNGNSSNKDPQNNGGKDGIISKIASASSLGAQVVPDGGNDSPAKLLDADKDISMIDQAVASLNQKIEADPTNPSLHNRLGLIYASVGELRLAEKQFNLAIDQSREKLAQANKDIAAKKAAGDLAAASDVMLTANQMELELSSAHSNLARVFEKLGQQSKVVAQLNELNKDVTIGTGPAQVVAQATAGRSSDATEDASKPLKKVSGELVTNFSKAQADLQSGRLTEASAELRACLAIDPDFAEAHEQLGAIALGAGNINQAVEELSRAAKLAPGKATVHASLGVAYQYKGKAQDAISEFNRALALNPKDASSAFNLGNAYAAANRTTDAINCYKKAVALSPDMAVAHNNLGSLYSQKNQNELAIKQFEAAIALAPTMASAHYGLGLAYFHSQNYTPAAREFRQAITLNPSLVDAHHKLSLCEKQSGGFRQHLHQDVAMR